ncbi:MAG: DUF5131 family protein [Ruminococcus sp.]|nr:DUF5131 family protein [Ruminococcus sp.]
MELWNPWHGCHKISAGCANCYMYRRDAEFGKDSSVVTKTASFDLPVRRGRDGEYKLQYDGTVFTCMTSDFFVAEADGWRGEAWSYIRQRSDLHFFIITKRIDRFYVSLPSDWGMGYENVTICSTCENQETADFRLPIMLDLPIRHMEIIHEPMLGRIDISKYLASRRFEGVTCGGESGPGARVCDYSWILFTREQCERFGTPFNFKQTGALFRKDGRLYRIPRHLQHSQAKKAGIDIP